MRVTKRRHAVRVLCLGLLSQPEEFETLEEAEQYAAEMRRIPGMVPLIEEDYECV